MSKRSLEATDPFPTPNQQQDAIDTVVSRKPRSGFAGMALLQGAITTAVIEQLASLPREAGLRVATVMVMLAGAAVQDTQDWQGLLQAHLAGSAPEDVAQ